MAEKKPKDLADPLHKSLIDWWCSDVYPMKYSCSYMFKGGQEGKLMKTALSWFRKEFRADTEEAFKKAANAFLSDQDSYLEDNHHPFSLFLSKPHKWTGKAKSKRLPANKIIGMLDVAAERQRVATRWSEVNHEEFIAKVLDAAKEDPMRYFKGFLQTEVILKLNNQELWRKVSVALADLIGRDRAKVMWQQKKSMLGAM